jgi:hypothetical protein
MEEQQLTDFGEGGSSEANSKDFDTMWCLHELVTDHPDFEVLCEPPLCPYHFRYVPHTLAERRAEPKIQGLLDRLNEEIVESLQRIGLNSVMAIPVQGRVAIQLSCRSNGSSASNVGATFEAIARWGRLLNTKRVTYQATTDMEDG